MPDLAELLAQEAYQLVVELNGDVMQHEFKTMFERVLAQHLPVPPDLELRQVAREVALRLKGSNYYEVLSKEFADRLFRLSEPT